MDALNDLEATERRRNYKNYETNKNPCGLDLLNVESNRSYLQEKNDFIQSWIANSKQINDYNKKEKSSINKSLKLVISKKSINNFNENNDDDDEDDDDDDDDEEIKIINGQTTISSYSTKDIIYQKTVQHNKLHLHNSNDADDDDDDDIDDTFDDLTKVTKDLIQSIKLNHDFNDIISSSERIELGRTFTCSTPKPTKNLNQIYSFIEAEVSSMNDNSSFNNDLDLDFESLELDCLKEIDSFNEKKSIDFNFKLKSPTHSLNQKKTKRKSNDLLKNLLIKTFSAQQQRKYVKLNKTNDHDLNRQNDRVKGFNILKEFLITKYQIH